MAVAALLSASAADPAQAAIPAPPAGFTTAWSSDFDGAPNSGLDAGVWQYDTARAAASAPVRSRP